MAKHFVSLRLSHVFKLELKLNLKNLGKFWAVAQSSIKYTVMYIL